MTFTQVKRFVKTKYLVAAFAATFVAFAGSTSVANATTGAGQAPTKEQCKNGGWQKLGYRNQGQCVREAAQNQGSGYGGNTNINIDIDINVNIIGNNNIVVIVVPPYL